MAVISIIQRRFYAPLCGVAECSGIGWRFGSEQGGGINRNGVAIWSGIRSYREFVSSFIGHSYENPLKRVVASTILGSVDFVDEIKNKYLSEKKTDRKKDPRGTDSGSSAGA